MFFRIFVNSWNEERRAPEVPTTCYSKKFIFYRVFFCLSCVEVVVEYGVVAVVVRDGVVDGMTSSGVDHVALTGIRLRTLAVLPCH